MSYKLLGLESVGFGFMMNSFSSCSTFSIKRQSLYIVGGITFNVMVMKKAGVFFE